MVYFILHFQVTGHHGRKSGKRLKAGTWRQGPWGSSACSFTLWFVHSFYYTAHDYLPVHVMMLPTTGQGLLCQLLIHDKP